LDEVLSLINDVFSLLIISITNFPEHWFAGLALIVLGFISLLLYYILGKAKVFVEIGLGLFLIDMFIIIYFIIIETSKFSK
jgi:hypothetical protein